MIVDLCGGLGNQLHQYAFGRSVALARNEELFFSKDDCGGNRPYALDAFNVKIQWANGRTGPLRGEPVFKFDPSVYTEPNGLRYRGYWQTEKYFNEPVIREDIRVLMNTDKLRDKAGEICSQDTRAFLHIRRGDYLREPHLSFHGCLSLNYYNRAIAHIRTIAPECTFYVFSDDPEWCRSNFPEFEVISGFKPFEDLQLMKLCHHAVIANSSFSFWGAWLGDEKPNRIVIAPERWFVSPVMCYSDVIPDRWTKMGDL